MSPFDTPNSFASFSVITTPFFGKVMELCRAFVFISMRGAKLFLDVAMMVISCSSSTPFICCDICLIYTSSYLVTLDDFKILSSLICSSFVISSDFVTTTSYFIRSPNCLPSISLTEDEIPSPAQSSATDPMTPNIVINIRCLYLNIFLAVTF